MTQDSKTIGLGGFASRVSFCEEGYEEGTMRYDQLAVPYCIALASNSLSRRARCHGSSDSTWQGFHRTFIRFGCAGASGTDAFDGSFSFHFAFLQKPIPPRLED